MAPTTAGPAAQEFDEFGLPIRKYVNPLADDATQSTGALHQTAADVKEIPHATEKTPAEGEEKSAEIPTVTPSRGPEEKEKPGQGTRLHAVDRSLTAHGVSATNDSDRDYPQDASSSFQSEIPLPSSKSVPVQEETEAWRRACERGNACEDEWGKRRQESGEDTKLDNSNPASGGSDCWSTIPKQSISGPSITEVQANKKADRAVTTSPTDHKRNESLTTQLPNASEFSHQQLTAAQDETKFDDDGEWQTMPAYAPYDIYDDDNKLIAREHKVEEDEVYGYAGLGGAGKGYTRVLEDDAESETSLDGDTKYLFKDPVTTSLEDDAEQRNAVSQLQATKDLLTEGQRIAYVGATRLELVELVRDAERIGRPSRKVKKDVQVATEAMKMWSQKIMIRLYTHMEISPAEQIMIEQLADHGVVPKDLTSVLMQNARVKNPMAEEGSKSPSDGTSGLTSMGPRLSTRPSTSNGGSGAESPATLPPPYEAHDGEEMPAVKMPSQLPHTAKIDIDLRWTVLCDLFLVLIADSVYDARSRVLLERVGSTLEIPWLDICRFEKRVTDALEMQQQAEKENWNEEEHLEQRRKLALKKRYVMMGLATVGGGLVIGLSAGLLAPMIGAGLAAGFTTIGVGGTSTFLAGTGGAAIITSGAAASGSFMGGKAANRRMGAVRTFEYRPLHNNKRVNLIVTISGWLTSKHDDVRLPFSTVDPVMGDMYSILWEPEMLTSMGDTINILATEALTSGLQQVLGSTILISLMAALQLPVVLSKLAYLIDNPWAVSLDRATAAGLVLADSLIDRNLGTRPITLVGYSLGSRVIFSCLRELARKGAYGLVQNVYMFGSPIVFNKDEYLKIRTVVAGRFVNGYNRSDWILGYLFRLTSGGIRRIAGLATVDDIPGVENIDCTEFVLGHMEYRKAMPRLLRECGWMVESDEFTEIEDPDPDKHREKQRELINEIEAARKDLEGKAAAADKKGGLASFFKKKKAQKQDWEIYEDTTKGPQPSAGAPGSTEDKLEDNYGVLFDVDAMRAELAKGKDDDQLQPRELKSTLPPMKVELEDPREYLRETRSEDSAARHRYGDGEEEKEIQMTFDTAHGAPDAPPKDDYYQPAIRPEIKRSSQTLPNLTLEDPWAQDTNYEDDDDDFGKEKEIELTFA